MFKNDKERKAFVLDPESWEDYPVNLVRTRCLTYGDKAWIKVECYEYTNRFDFEKRNVVQVKEWVQKAIFLLDRENRVLDYASNSTIIDEIKRQDKEGKQK